MKPFDFLWAFAAVVLAAAAAPAAPAPSLVRPGENVALGRSYTLSPRPDYHYCTDPDDLKQLTDGVYTTGYFWTQKSTVGWQGVKTAVIKIDLGKVEPVCGASFNTAAGVAGVAWPTAIYVLASDDGKNFHEAGELTALGARQGVPPATGYAVHRFWTDTLRTHGRYIMLVVIGGSYNFADEVEVYRGQAALLNLPLAGEAVTDGKAFARARQSCESVARRLRADAQAVRKLSANATVSAAVRMQVEEQLARVEAQIPNLPRHYDEGFQALLPLNEAHQRVFRAQAAVWRATGAPRLTAWQSGSWDPLSPVHAARNPGRAAVSVAMMRNEFRAGAFNVSNAGDEDETLNLRITGLPGGENPAWITVHEVQWTDTQSGQPVAAALPEARREGGAFVIRAAPGLTRQVWLTLHPTDVPPGRH
ncbi:MAG: discoidin domain-containing protein, partial [Limisphaerales bacterium]